MPLFAHPGSWVGIPVVPLVRDGTGRRFDVGPLTFAAYGTFHRRSNECAASPRPAQGVDLGEKLVIQLYVQSHVLNIAPSEVNAPGDRSSWLASQSSVSGGCAVAKNRSVCRQQHHVLEPSLGQQHSVEWVGVDRRQRGQFQNMPAADG